MTSISAIEPNSAETYDGWWPITRVGPWPEQIPPVLDAFSVYVADGHFDAVARDNPVELYDDPTPLLEVKIAVNDYVSRYEHHL